MTFTSLWSISINDVLKVCALSDRAILFRGWSRIGGRRFYGEMLVLKFSHYFSSIFGVVSAHLVYTFFELRRLYYLNQ